MKARADKAVGTEIRQARESRGWKRSRLANELNRVSGLVTTAKYVARWELGERRPGYVWGPVIERVLGLDLDAIEVQARGALRATEANMPSHLGDELRRTRQQLSHIPPVALGRSSSGSRVARSAAWAASPLAEQGRHRAQAGGPSDDDAVHAAIPRLRRALDSIDLPDDGPTRSNHELTGEVATLVDHRLQARYVALAWRLPNLISELARATQTNVGRDARQAAALLTLAFRAADGVAYKYGYQDLSARIIDLMRASAMAAENPHLLAAVAYVRTETFFATGDLAVAARFLVAAADELPSDLTRGAATAAAYGALHMRAAVVAGRAGKADIARDHLAEAHRAANLAREDVYFGTAFGPESVRVHELAMAVELGDCPAAVERAAAWHPPEHLPAERRSHYYIDLARAQLRLDHHEDALDCLHTARGIAPLHVREHPQVHDTLSALLRTSRSPDDRLLELATWARVR